MALSKKPVTGMKDILPAEMEIRDYCISVIKDTYAKFGFTSIETPCVENIANLTNKQGGDNEKLIFKILKRGEKLNLETAQSEADLVDGGLRYDLTVPLCRFYSNNANNLPTPFKALQMGNVWRADRPQRGRYRQFMQCDIDILGEPSNLAEIELILATTTTLGRLGFKNFQIRINERRILKAMAAYSGFPEESFDKVFIILDKMDKIGKDGVAQELKESGFDPAGVEKYLSLFESLEQAEDGLEWLKETLGETLEGGVIENLQEIVESVTQTKAADFEMVFDPTLVRGMSYYTGTIFEIAIPEFGGSCGGGGRYDSLVRNLGGEDTPAIGFAMGMERLASLIGNKEMQKTQAFVVSNNMQEALKLTEEMREKGISCEFDLTNKKFVKQLEKASKVARYALILGEDEIASNQVTVKNLDTSEQQTYIRNEVKLI